MAIERRSLDMIKVASPCNVSWETMKGDDQVRFCGQCQLNVYNLSTMNLDQISSLLEKKEGRTCVRFYRRADGTVITDDCPVGLRRVRRKMALVATAVAGLFATVGTGMFTTRGAMARTLRDSALGRVAMFRAIADWMEPERVPVAMGMMVMPQPEPAHVLQGRVAAPVCNPVPLQGTVAPIPSGVEVKQGEVSIIQGGVAPAPRAFMGDAVMPEHVRQQPVPKAPGNR